MIQLKFITICFMVALATSCQNSKTTQKNIKVGLGDKLEKSSKTSQKQLKMGFGPNSKFRVWAKSHFKLFWRCV